MKIAFYTCSLMESCLTMRRVSPVKLSCFHGHATPFPATLPRPALIGMSTAHTLLAPPLNCSRCASSAMSAGLRLQRRAYDGLLLDAGGTLLQLSRPVEETYATIGRKFGIEVTESDIKQGFKRAFAAPWSDKLRYKDEMGDGRDFWRFVVSEATCCSDTEFFEEVYQHYAHGDAWRLPAGAYEGMCLLKDAGVKLAVVSNFDTRLNQLLNDLGIAQLFDAIVISSEFGYEKPDACIFLAALGFGVAMSSLFPKYAIEFLYRLLLTKEWPDIGAYLSCSWQRTNQLNQISMEVHEDQVISCLFSI